ncbi:MAG: HAMP domain-containing protein, partial [Anaerolineae bacterium]|nr:HAMP domain-containing protein [Anaerolineae bacterium]
MPLFRQRNTISDEDDTFSRMEPVVFRRLRDDPQGRPWHFLSLRWKVIAPLALTVLIVGMLGSYLVGTAIATAADAQETEHVLDAAETVAARLNDLSTTQQREVTRIAYTQGVPELVAAGDARALHTLLEPLAAAADLDYVLIADPLGVEIVGLQRVVTETGASDYAVATGTDLTVLLDSAPALGGTSATIHAALARTGQEHALLTTGPIMHAEARIGTVLVGTQTGRLLEILQGGDGADLALFGAAGEFVRTTLPFDEQTRDALTLSPELYRQALTTPGQVPIATLTLDDRPHHAAYIPLVIGGTPLGVLGIYVEDDAFTAALASQERLGLLFASLVGLVIVIAFSTIGSFTRRVERVTATADAMASGDLRARTGMQPGDEIGELGATLDRLADRQQRRTDALQGALRKERAESARLIAILESIPDGIVVQDLDGRVLLINDAARTLIGGQRVFRAKRLHELTAVVTEKLGPALAPGIYALGDPTRVPLEGKMLQAQAAAIVIKAKRRDEQERRIGTVIVLRDITDEVRCEQARETLLDRLADEAIVPTSPQATSSLTALAREFVRNTRAMQRVI